MRRYMVLIMLVMLCQFKVRASATDSIPADPKDVSTADALLAAVYNTISGPAGELRNLSLIHI